MPAEDTHFTPEQIAAWRDNAAAPADLFALGDHLAGCADCRARVAEGDTNAGGNLPCALGVDPDDPDAHLSYNLLEGWVDKTLTARERELVSTHLAACDRCQSDAEGLTAFAADLRAEIRADGEAAALVPQAVAAVPGKGRRWWQGASLGLAGAAAGTLLAYVVVARPVQTENTRLAARARESAALVQTAQAEAAKARGAAEKAERDAQAFQAQVAAKQSLLQTAQAAGQKAARERIAAEQQAGRLAQANAALAERLATGQKGAGGSVSVAVVPPPLAEKTFQAAVTTGKLPTLPVGVASALRPDSVRGARPPFTGLQPSAARVLARRPALSWNRASDLDAGTAATLVVRDANGKEVARHALAPPQTTYTLDTPLTRGAIYTWRLVGPDAKSVSGTARFQIADTQSATRYAQTLLRLAVAQTGDGLYNEARATLAQVVSLDAGEATTKQAERLLSRLRGK